jgi:eukaryotic-like serine/threonine-protein kinase
MAGIIDKKPEIDTKALVGREINNIILMELIGRGAMGAVFVGYQKSLKRKVAVKIFPKKAANNGKYKIFFREEAEIVSGLNHQNIVPVYDMGDTGEYLYITMQLVLGEDLRTMLKRYRLHPVPSRRQIETGTVLSIMVPVLDALAYAHEEGVIHQDIKPGNILIEERGRRPFLADFGIARSAMNEQYESSMIMGTPLYIAPELIREEPVDPRSDIYSAGTVLYEAIAGKLPFQKTTVEALLNIKMNNPEALYTQSPSAYCKQIDTELEKIILKAIASDKNLRYSSCRAFHDHLFNYQMNRIGRGGI